MNQRSQEFIEQDTTNLLKQFNLFDKLPIDVSKLCRKLGYSRVETDFEDGLSGAAIIEGGKKIISVNKGQHINRKRFTIGHEICHLRHHSDKSIHLDRNIFYRSDSNASDDWREFEANRFAAALLMPISHIKEQIQQVAGSGYIGEEEIELLASKFKVSNQAMCIRLKDLNLI